MISAVANMSRSETPTALSVRLNERRVVGAAEIIAECVFHPRTVGGDTPAQVRQRDGAAVNRLERFLAVAALALALTARDLDELARKRGERNGPRRNHGTALPRAQNATVARTSE